MRSGAGVGDAGRVGGLCGCGGNWRGAGGRGLGRWRHGAQTGWQRLARSRGGGPAGSGGARGCAGPCVRGQGGGCAVQATGLLIVLRHGGAGGKAVGERRRQGHVAGRRPGRAMGRWQAHAASVLGQQQRRAVPRAGTAKPERATATANSAVAAPATTMPAAIVAAGPRRLQDNAHARRLGRRRLQRQALLHAAAARLPPHRRQLR